MKLSVVLTHSLLRYKDRRWDSKRMLDSGGMPSSHSATVTALTVAIGLDQGTGGPAFAIALVLSLIVCSKFCPFFSSFRVLQCVCSLCCYICYFHFYAIWKSLLRIQLSEHFQVMYDATGVRLHAGRQAEVISPLHNSCLKFGLVLCTICMVIFSPQSLTCNVVELAVWNSD